MTRVIEDKPIHVKGRSEEEMRKALARLVKGEHRLCVPPDTDDDDIVLSDAIGELLELRQSNDQSESR